MTPRQVHYETALLLGAVSILTAWGTTIHVELSESVGLVMAATILDAANQRMRIISWLS